jgi:uncharacterized protein (DUF952 family)
VGFSLQINTVLRSDEGFDLTPGAMNAFSRPGSRIFFDTLPIWLVRRDWTALAEITLLAQARAAGQVSGTFRVLRAYEGAEQATMTAVFRRMYASGGAKHIYLLVSEAEHLVAAADGELLRPSLESEGFLHASPADQLTRVANKFYTDTLGTRVLVVALDRIAAELRWEPATGGLYPHIYGPLNMDAVDRVVSVSRGPRGAYDIRPADLGPDRALPSV